MSSNGKIQADVRKRGDGEGEGRGGGSTLLGLDWFTVYCLRGGTPLPSKRQMPKFGFPSIWRTVKFKVSTLS